MREARAATEAAVNVRMAKKAEERRKLAIQAEKRLQRSKGRSEQEGKAFRRRVEPAAAGLDAQGAAGRGRAARRRPLRCAR